MGVDTNIDEIAAPLIQRKVGSIVEIGARATCLSPDLGFSIRRRLRLPFIHQLRKLKACEEDIALYLLAHEIHHIDECERMAACGIKYGHSDSALAGGARADFPPPWKAAVQALTEEYPIIGVDQSGLLRTAGDIANEAAADLSALFWMKQSERDWESFANRLISARASGTAPLSRLERFIENLHGMTTRNYDIAEPLSKIVANGLPDLPTVYAECWEMAMNKALDWIALDGNLKNKSLEIQLRSLPPLILSTSPQAIAAGKPPRQTPPKAKGP